MNLVEHLTAENARLRAALEQVAKRTIQKDLNRLAHAALGHEINPLTVQLMAEIDDERALARWFA